MTQDRPSASVREWSIGARGRATGAQDDGTDSADHSPGQVAGGWRTGDPGRKYAEIGDLPLEQGGSLPAVVIAYETWGRPNAARDNAVLICHALTGDAHVVGSTGPGQPTPGWWDGLIGTGRYVDPADWYVVAANVLRLSTELIDARPDAGPLRLIRSPYGHDGFLIEFDQVGNLIADTLDDA